jgi:biopolymer transport protein ExbD
MQFYKKRHSASSVPIVPMVDILTILLIFFIVHTQWKKPQSVLKIDVPSVEYMNPDREIERRGVLAVGADSSVSFNGEIVSLNQLPEFLKSYKEANPDKKLQLDVDQGAAFGTIVQIWDILTGVGIDANEVPARIEVQPASSSH